MVLAGVVLTISPGDLPGYPGMRNPFGLEGHPTVAQWLPSVIALLPVCILASAVSLVMRYRRSGGMVRQQIKWVAFAASFVGLVYGITLLAGLVFAPDALTTEESPLWMALLQNTVLMSYAGIPIAVGIAVLRYRLYDIDLIINRTLVYGSLTLLLALVYLGGVAAMQASFRAITGMEQQPQLSVVVSTLAIAALFNPLRRRIQSFIDRSFYRRKYNARNTLEAFSARLRNETDLDDLSENLVEVVRETLQPRQAYLWLREPDGTGAPDPGGNPGVGP